MDDVLLDEPVIQRAMARYPKQSELVAQSTPVVSFGNPLTARVVTVGINPSSVEFQKKDASKSLLPVGEKRLVDLETLGVEQPENLNREQAIQVIRGCYKYFEKGHNPYGWFDHLNKNVNTFFQADYYDGSAAHLDLVQWATDPVWGRITDQSTKDEFLQNDVNFLRYQVNLKKYDLIFINGKQVFEQLTQNKIVQAGEKTRISYLTKAGKELPISFYQGESSNGSLVLGWSKTFPGHYISGDQLPSVVDSLHRFFQKYKN